MSDIQKEKDVAEAAVSSVKAIMYAIDVPKLKQIVMGMFNVCLACLATFSNHGE